MKARTDNSSGKAEDMTRLERALLAMAGVVLIGLGVNGLRHRSPAYRLAQRLAIIEQERQACARTCSGADAERCAQDCAAIARVRIEGETTLALNEMSPVPTVPAR